VLPEVLARPGAAAAMQAVDDGRGDAAGFQNKPWHPGGKFPADADGARNGGGVGERRCMLGHSGYPIRLFRRPTTAAIVSPSARAPKVNAMRCFSTGSASAITSSTDGA